MAGSASEGEVQAQLQEPRAPNSVLNHTQAALRWNRRRTHEVGEEHHVIVGRVEIGMVEHIKRIGAKTHPKALLDGEFLSHTHVEANLKRSSEQVAA
jgi:hypothetical protein